MKKLITLLILAGTLLATLPAKAQRSENALNATGRNLEILGDIYRQLDQYYVDSLSADTVMRWAIAAMLRRVDPFTVYYPDDDMDDLKQMTTGKYGGIGSVIRFHKKQNHCVVVEPYVGTPSAEVGLRAGDVLLRVDDRDLSGMPSDEVTNLLRGDAGTSFLLTVNRAGQEMQFNITRRNIQLPAIPYYGMLDQEVGYIQLSGFTEGSAVEVRQALLDLKGQGMRRLVFDLRNNGGGSLSEAVDIINLFVPKGQKVVYCRGKVPSSNRDYYTNVDPVDLQLPIAVLVDDGTASAAEIVSGSLQDLDRAVVVGLRTYGKGLVQSVHEVAYRGELKITTSRYYIPSGRCIQAYDYRHLNEDGSVGTVPDSLTNVFHTAGGREVRDGGGIKPDIEVQLDTLATMVLDVVPSDEMFDYVTLYVQQHPSIAPAGQFRIGDEDYAAFASYMQEQGFTYNRRSEELLQLLQEVARQEGYLEVAEQEFEALKAKFTTDLARDFERNRQDIETYLNNEIVTRYYYRAGFVQQALQNDPILDKALEILNDRKEYKKILSK